LLPVFRAATASDAFAFIFFRATGNRRAQSAVGRPD
jgi:hypothetical protein